VEIGRVIGGHYLLQSLIKQGQYAVVYQGIDQAFQRLVAVKAIPAVHIPAYRAAIRKTSQFSYPNIIGLYDLVVEQERLYLIQEFVDGDDFATLLQAPLQAHEVAGYGYQICSALLYACSSTRRICHGDLTPSAILRDRRGLMRVNNFALPSDLNYFTTWSIVGGEGLPLSDQDLPWGAESQGRHADDARAVGLLLYQLLAGRPPAATVVEPPADGRLRFRSSTPPELCNVVARTMILHHPQHINTVEVLSDELKLLAETLEPAVPVLINTPTYQPAAQVQQAQEVAVRARQFPPSGTGNLANPLPGGQPGPGLPAYQLANSGKLVAASMEPADPVAPTVADFSLLSATAHKVAPSTSYLPETDAQAEVQRPSLVLLLLLGLVVFALFFVVGFFASNAFIHP
jgi:hypothetical protein